MLQTLGNVRGIANLMPVIVKLDFTKLFIGLSPIVHLQTVKPIVQDCFKTQLVSDSLFILNCLSILALIF